MAHLRKLGFNRVSMGVQDFDEHVQKAVNRYNSADQVNTLVRAIREQEYHSISMNLIYGLPVQTLASVATTLDQVIEMSPDRLSLFNYAHMPHLFKSQGLINAEEQPSPQLKLELLHMAIETLQVTGYVYVGMDHFAKPEDSLVIAQQQGRLQRNFQGYSTHGGCDLLAFGVSSISAFGDVYVQNAKVLESYQRTVDDQKLRFIRGFVLSEEDKLRQYIINKLNRHFQLDNRVVEIKFAVNVSGYFADELTELHPMADDGLVEIDQNGFKVTNAGRLLIRRICMIFDGYLQTGSTARYSRII